MNSTYPQSPKQKRSSGKDDWIWTHEGGTSPKKAPDLLHHITRLSSFPSGGIEMGTICLFFGFRKAALSFTVLRKDKQLWVKASTLKLVQWYCPEHYLACYKNIITNWTGGPLQISIVIHQVSSVLLTCCWDERGYSDIQKTQRRPRLEKLG